MTHGRKTKRHVNSRTKKSASLLTHGLQKSGNSLESRVAELEARIEEMQGEINDLSGGVPARIFEAIDGIGKKQRGPKRNIEDTELLLIRDNLVRWLEEHWPRIAKLLLRAKTQRDIAAVLAPIAAPPDVSHTWQLGIMDHPDELLDFLRSRKFRRKPPKKTVLDALAVYQSDERKNAANRLPTRQIANAMAGVPKLKWRTSFDRCSSCPSSYQIGHNTADHYRAVFGIPEQT
jgi:hypothetical protein